MISKSTIKSIRLLHQKKYREELGLFIAEGPKVVNELIQCGYSAKELFTADDSWANDAANPTLISEKELASISCLHTPNKVLGVFAIPQRILDTTSLKGKLVLVLDDIRDPGNLGTMIRMADWFGIATILCSENCVDVFNPKTVQATMGSLARVNVHYESLMEVLPHFENVYAATLKGENIYRQKLPAHAAILIGSESHGISPLLMKYVSTEIAIPNFSSRADSLNAAMACAIICSEFRRL